MAGLGLPSEPEAIVEYLLRLGAVAEEVCYFSTYRVSEAHSFGQAIHGEVVRLYCYAGDEGHIYENIGKRTEAEKELSLNFATEDEEIFEDDFDEINEEDIMSLAEKMSLSPRRLIGMEEQECVVADIV